MIIIYLPDNNIEERKYIVNLFFGNYLGLKYKIIISNSYRDYIIKINGQKLIIKDYFFSNFPNSKSYLNRRNLPNIKFEKFNSVIDKKIIPILYGRNLIKFKKNIECHIDIFSSSFFMLTRWEEFVNSKQKDEFGRFDEKKSFSYQNGFTKIPIVNEYISLLKKLINKIDSKILFKKHNYSLKITHDVDQFLRYPNFFKYFKALAGDLFIRKSPKLVIKTTIDFINSQKNYISDPYFSFNYFMNISEKFNLKSHFYFIPSVKGDYDFRYSIESLKLKKIICDILNRNHIVGIHPSWNSFNNKSIFSNELNRLDKYDISEGRQHYLRFDVPKTWQIWNNNGLKIDSSMGYSNFNGFRCGICYDFNVFDIQNQKTLNLIESPLIFMDTTIIKNKMSYDDVENELKYFRDVIRKFNGNFVFLWHTNNVINDWNVFFKNYEKLLKIIHE